jgi:hypothetical protein
MISRYRRYFLFLVFVLLATPLVVGLLMPESEVEFRKEGRNRSPTPSLPHSLDEVAALPKELDDYLCDRFGVRKQMIGWYAKLREGCLAKAIGSFSSVLAAECFTSGTTRSAKAPGSCDGIRR